MTVAGTSCRGRGGDWGPAADSFTKQISVGRAGDLSVMEKDSAVSQPTCQEAERPVLSNSIGASERASEQAKEAGSGVCCVPGPVLSSSQHMASSLGARQRRQSCSFLPITLDS